MTSLQALIDTASQVRQNAYAPYSHFRVGAALTLNDGRVFTGINVENCSFGLTVCAERHAIAAAVQAGAQPGDVRMIVVVADNDAATTPCGACRQVIAEFAPPEAKVVMHNLRDGVTTERALADLLPDAFIRFTPTPL